MKLSTVPPKGVLHHKRSPYQDIFLRSDGRGLFLTLNGSPQVHSSEEGEYHECIATIPLLLASGHCDVAILGGGDGLAARNILDFNQVESCTLVELDPGMLELCSMNPYWRRLTGGSLTDRRLKVVVGDGIAWQMKVRKTFDVIIHDLEMSFTEQPEDISVERCYDYFNATYARLNPGGIWVLTVADDTDEGLPDGVFAYCQDRLPVAVQRQYSKMRGVIAKARLLLQTFYAHVSELTIHPKILGTHTTFYISNKPIGGFRRQPPLPLRIPHVEHSIRRFPRPMTD